MGRDENEVVTTAEGLRHWRVAGGVLRRPDGALLLVENERRNGDVDWTTPGGVVDDGESYVGALTREVQEETGLTVASWTGPAYRVEVTAPELGFFLQVEAHVADAWSGSIAIDDPDGIVLSALFCDAALAAEKLASAPVFVSEPLGTLLSASATPNQLFEYRIEGRGADRQVLRTA